MKEGKLNRAMSHIDDELIAGAMRSSDLNGGTKIIKGKGKIMKNKIWTKWVAVAAAFVLVIGAGIFVGGLLGRDPSAVIALDVNPSIEIEVNGKEEITEVRALNEDARIVLEGLKLSEVDLNTAMYAIVGSMLEHGYLSTEENSILVSIDAKSQKRADELREKISGDISTLFGEQNISASVITQSFKNDKETEKKANANGISPAKATLISKIVAAGLLDARGVPYTYEVLAGLKVNELKLILESKSVEVDGIKASGTAGAGKYISADEALAVALDDAGVESADVNGLEIEMDYDDDRRAMVWEIEFYFGENKHEYELIAESGEIVEREVKPRDNDGDDKPIEAPAEAIAREKALELAYADAKVAAADVRRPEIELDIERGVYVYEVEFKTADREYEYVIDAKTGDILERENEPRD